MAPLAQMALASVACWAAVAVLLDGAARVAVLLGAAGPLAVAAGTWLVIERTQRRQPERVSGVMIKLFAAKLVLVGAYVAAVVKLLPSGSVPFVVSFVCQYVLLHVIEAFHLRRLFAGDRRAAAR